MKFAVTYPMVAHPSDPALTSGEAIARFARAAEQAGIDGIGFTDHPAPTHRWLQAGGHDALDPFVALTWCAAVTERIRLIPNILVLPYRNPFIVAKAAATLDALSGGRFTLAVGTGYLRGEYRALGVDFDERNARFDEAVEVIRGVWSTDDFVHAGTHFEAVGQTANPKPSPLPPVWIGGNSHQARRRVARYGDGWRPFPAPAQLSRTAKTAPLETAADLAVMLDELWELVDAAGRDRSGIDVSFTTTAGGDPTQPGFDAAARLAAIDELAALGVTWCDVGVPGDSVDHAIDGLARIGELVIAPSRARSDEAPPEPSDTPTTEDDAWKR